jgi:excisionase family DNA binding protein
MVPEDALSLSEVARQLRVNPATVRLWVSQGRLRAHKAGASERSRWWVRPEDLEAMLEARRNPRAGASDDRVETDYQPGPDEPGLGMLSSFDLDEDDADA